MMLANEMLMHICVYLQNLSIEDFECILYEYKIIDSSHMWGYPLSQVTIPHHMVEQSQSDISHVVDSHR